MHLEKFLNTKTGRIIMSILLGFGLATCFRAICKGDNCKLIHAPPMEELDEQIYKFDNKCYKMIKNPVKCNSNKNIVNFK
jgi:hypothetical protein